MYSRNMRMQGSGNKIPNNVNEGRQKTYPTPPPNYRGMVYTAEKADERAVCAEGIDRIVSNDGEYSEMLNGKKRMKCVLSDKCECVMDEKYGINAVVDGLSCKKFDPEDILVCAMILLMLNDSGSEDMLMILVLLMLL